MAKLNKVRVQVMLDPDEAEKLKNEARKLSISVSTLIRQKIYGINNGGVK